jgi:hypothetical protein
VRPIRLEDLSGDLCGITSSIATIPPVASSVDEPLFIGRSPGTGHNTSEKAWRNVFIPILAVALISVGLLWLWEGAY